MEYGFAGRPEPASAAAPWNHPRVTGHRHGGIWRSPRVNQEQDQITESDLEPSRAARIDALMFVKASFGFGFRP